MSRVTTIARVARSVSSWQRTKIAKGRDHAMLPVLIQNGKTIKLGALTTTRQWMQGIPRLSEKQAVQDLIHIINIKLQQQSVRTELVKPRGPGTKT